EWLPLLGIWPVIMGITMWIQMQLNPQQPDPVQQAVFNWMPVLFTFLLASFPAGLVIYWAWNNVLSIAQQYFIMKRQGVEVHLRDNLKKTGAAVAGLAGSARGAIGSKKKSDASEK
ncbi:MAG: YidC/Oxa1 family membrane protein insertase, partial [Pseudomonadota bacterium]